MKQKHIIALWGSANCGKTSTLREIFNQLIGCPQCESIEDIRAIVKYEGLNTKYNGYSFLFATWGDDEVKILDNIDFMKSNHWNFALTATRTKGGTTNRLDRYCDEYGVVLHWIKKHSTDLKEEEKPLNSKDAKDIMELIDAIIDGKNLQK